MAKIPAKTDVNIDKPAPETGFAPQTEMRTLVPRRRRHFLKTYEERAELGVRELRVPATWEEFLELWETADYRVFYRDGHMISFLEIENGAWQQAGLKHEMLVPRMAYLLGDLLDSAGLDFMTLGSNARILSNQKQEVHLADLSIVKGRPDIRNFGGEKEGIVNPWLVVEVLSNSTRDFDLSEKLADYKQIPSLQQIIFVEQSSLWASTYIRVGAQEWRNLDFTSMSDKIPVADGCLSLERVFAKVL